MAVDTEVKPDFGGWATKAGLVCADGLTIGHDAFKDQDGIQVPLVYQHGHDEITNVLGHAILENRGEGVYAHCYFNGTQNGQAAKEAVSHGDLTQLSIYANRLQKTGSTVRHGVIREVSLVLAGANPGAVIDFVEVHHGDMVETIETAAVITTGLELMHGDLDPDDPKVIWASMTSTQQALVQQLMHTYENRDDKDDDKDDTADTNDAADDKPADDDKSDEGEDKVDTEDADADKGDADKTDTEDADADKGESAEHSDTTNNDDLKGSAMGTDTAITHNVFDQDALAHAGLTGKAKDGMYVLSHADKEGIFGTALATKSNSLKEVVEGFKAQHGIDNIEILFPDAKAVSDTPEWVKRRTEWVDRVLRGAKHLPFTRIKSLSADITLEQARAKGYIKGALKKEEFFSVAKRVTTPQTIYKKQKLDRDDILDITDFDVVVWLKGEMRLMLDEEIARAVLLGDGRSNADDDKILEDKVRPIASDHELFQTTITLTLADNTSAEKIVDYVLLNRRFYKGSGNPDFFTTEEIIARLLNVKDNQGRRIYTSMQDLATTMRVNAIIPVEVMEEYPDIIGILVNLQDYSIGADKGGDVAMFDDFDIDYNQYKYLIETRISGALTKPKSAIVLRRAADNAVAVTPVAPTWNDAEKEGTIPTTTGVAYKNQTTGAVLADGATVTLAEDQTFTVVAVPDSDAYFIESTDADQFTFTYDDGLTQTH